MRSLVALLFSCAVCLGQLPVIPFVTQPVSSSVPIPNTIPGLALWWVHTDLATNTALSGGWTDRIQGMVLSVGASGVRPTNSALGVGFGGTGSATYITNAPQYRIGTNWTVIQFINTSKPDNASGVASGTWGENGSNWMFGTQFQGTSKQSLAYRTHAGGNVNYGGLLAPGASNEFDVTLIDSNSATSGGKFFTYTNAVLYSTPTASDADTYFGEIGADLKPADALGAFYAGYVRETMVWTQAVLTPIQLSNIHYYRTNTYGGSP